MRRVVPTALAIVLLTGCTPGPLLASRSDKIQVVTTTALLRDLVENVGGSRVEAVSIVPDGADPHTYEPTLRDARNIVYADVAFSNYALLEEHSVIEMLDTNLPDEAVSVSLAEDSVRYAADLISLVEDPSLDTVWLGIRTQGGDLDRSNQVFVQAIDATGPGALSAYLTGTFGEPEIYLDSADGFDEATGYRNDTVELPPDAHTHVSWAFTKPGIYTLTLRAQVQNGPTDRPVEVSESTFQFAVGVDPSEAGPGREVIDGGHADLTVDLDTDEFVVRNEPLDGGVQTIAADEAVIVVPASALQEIPSDPQFRFLGHPGDPVYLLAQAVLGKHVHGEIDPHLWQNVRNTMAYVQLIRDTLIAVDPEGTSQYTAQTAAYLAELEVLDDEVRTTIAQIPADRRYLVTTHDAFAYLTQGYDITIAGFVTSSPAAEPSMADRRRLAQTLTTLDIPAVFLEPNLVARSATLTDVADDLGVEVCPIYGDAFDDQVTTYVQMMRFNANSLYRCLATPEDP